MSVALVTVRPLVDSKRFLAVPCMAQGHAGTGKVTHSQSTAAPGESATADGLALLCTKCANVVRGEAVSATDEATVWDAAERLGSHAQALRDNARDSNVRAYVAWAQGASESVHYLPGTRTTSSEALVDLAQASN